MKSQDIQELISLAKKPAFDFHDTLNSGRFVPPKQCIVITASLEDEKDAINEECSLLGLEIGEVHFRDGIMSKEEHKASKINELGIDYYFENDPSQVYYLKKHCPKCTIVYINAKNYAIFSYSLEGLSYALRLKEEGNNVVIGILTPEEGLEKKKDPESDKRRLSTGDGLIKRVSAKTLFNILMALPEENRQDYIVDFDFSVGGEYGEKLEKAGFKGIFTRKSDTELEKDRQIGQEFVKRNYKHLKVPQETHFKSIDDAKKLIEASEDIYVCKCSGDGISAFVPVSKDYKTFKDEMNCFLDLNKADLEKAGFIMQKMILEHVEAIPSVLFRDGMPLYGTLDIETKKYGNDDCGKQTGASNTLIAYLDLNSKLSVIGLKDYFPIAFNKKSNNFIDSGILFDLETEIPYFTEFCPRRGYDDFPVQLSMLPSASHYWECITNGMDPFKSTLFIGEEKPKMFGFGIRIFSQKTDGERYSAPDINVFSDSRNVYFYDLKIKDKRQVTSGYVEDICVVTGSGDSVDEAMTNAYTNLKDVVMSDMYYRSDFNEDSHYWNIKYRYNWLKQNKLI